MTRQAVPGRYRKMLDLLVRKSKELHDALRNAGGAQYAELQAMQALVLGARAGIAAKMSVQAQQGELDYPAERN